MGYLPLSNWDPNTLQGHNRPELFTQKLLPALVGIQVVGWKRPRPFCGYVLRVEARHKSVIPVSDAEEISFGEQPIARGRFWNGIQSFLGRIPYDCGLTN